MGSPSPGHCESVNSGEILLPFRQPGLEGRLREKLGEGQDAAGGEEPSESQQEKKIMLKF